MTPSVDQSAVASPKNARSGFLRLECAPKSAGLLLCLLSGFFLWFLCDWWASYAQIHFPSQRAWYLSWAVIQIVATVSFGAGFLAFFKARLRWSRIVFSLALLEFSALLQVAGALVFEHVVPNPGEDRLIWVGTWMLPLITTCHWAACVMTSVTGVLLAGIAWSTLRDGTLGDLKLLVRQWFRSLLVSPWSVAFGPIFVKEIRVAGRRPGTYWMRGVYVLALLGLISMLYMGITLGEARYQSAGAQRLEELQQVAPSLAVAISWFQYVVLLLFAAALTAPSIGDERRARTLSALMTTPMNSAQIVFGKLMSRMMLLFIIALISVPFLLGARIFGGLDAESVLAMTIVTISSSLFMASLGTLFSIWTRKSTAAAVMTIFSYLLIQFGPVLVIILIMIQGSAMGRGGPPEELILLSSPITMMGITAQIMGGGGPGLPIRLMWTMNSALNVVFSVITLLIASGALRRVMLSDPAAEMKAKPKGKKKPRGAATPPVVPASAGGEPNGTTDTAAAAPPTVPEAPSEEVFVERDREVWDQPVLWREMRQPALGSKRNLIVATVVVALVSLWLYAEVPPSEDDVYPIVAAIGMLIVCFAAAISTTSSVSGEREASTWQVLLTTPLRPMEILGAKLVGALRRHWFIATALALHMAIGVFFAGMHVTVFLHLGLIIFAVATLMGGTGILLSVLVSRPLAAMLLNLLLGAILWMGAPMLALFISEFVYRGRRNDSMLDVALSMNPMFMSVTATDGAAKYGRRSVLDYDMPSAHWGWFGFTSALVIACAVGIVLGLLATYLACRVFVRKSGRAS